MKKLFVLFMLLIPVISYSQEKATANTSNDVITVTLSVESRYEPLAPIIKNYLVMESSEPIGVSVTVYFTFDWEGQIDLWWDTLLAGKTRDRNPLRETMEQDARLLEVKSYSPTQYNGKPIVVTIQD